MRSGNLLCRQAARYQILIGLKYRIYYNSTNHMLQSVEQSSRTTAGGPLLNPFARSQVTNLELNQIYSLLQYNTGQAASTAKQSAAFAATVSGSSITSHSSCLVPIASRALSTPMQNQKVIWKPCMAFQLMCRLHLKARPRSLPYSSSAMLLA